MAEPAYDVIVIGGGPAGLQAALTLARCTRKVLVLDSGEYRNAAARKIGGFLTRDGISPNLLRRIGRAEVIACGAEIREATALNIRRTVLGRRFDIEVQDRGDPRPAPRPLQCRKVVLATGLVDVLPEIPGLAALYGKSVFHCPYCDAYDVRGQPLGVIGADGGDLARALKTWSKDVTLFTNGVIPVDRSELQRLDVAIVFEPITRFEGNASYVGVAGARSGAVRTVRALFLKLAGQRQRSDLAERLGLRVGPDGVEHGPKGATAIPGVYVAGDASKDTLLSIVGAGEGAQVGVAINMELRLEDEQVLA